MDVYRLGAEVELTLAGLVLSTISVIQKLLKDLTGGFWVSLVLQAVVNPDQPIGFLINNGRVSFFCRAQFRIISAIPENDGQLI